MRFLRNSEIKILVAVLSLISIAAIIVGFFINQKAGILACAICILLSILFLLFTRYRYKKIENLNIQLDSILHGNYSLNLDNFDEGELSLLASEIYKMTVTLREHSSILLRDKQYLSDSLADIAHQLRTPLTSINMIVGFLNESDLSISRRKELVKELSTLLSRIDWLITTLLRISKIDAGTAAFKSDTIPVKTLINKTIELFSIPLELRNISLIVKAGSNTTNKTNTTVFLNEDDSPQSDASTVNKTDINTVNDDHSHQSGTNSTIGNDLELTASETKGSVATDLGIEGAETIDAETKGSVTTDLGIEDAETIDFATTNIDPNFIGDFSWTTEALGNIIKNCMEHTKDGGEIQISYSQNPIHTVISIKDNGSGIDETDLPHLFERFYQGKNSSANSFGIGLALSRMIIAKQNGTIKAENNIDGGACFTIRFFHKTI